MPIRGRHQSSCSSGKRTLDALRALPGVEGVVIGISKGGKSLAGGSAGFLKLQRQVPGGFKALLQTSRGIQEVFVKVSAGMEAKVKLEVEWMFNGK